MSTKDSDWLKTRINSHERRVRLDLVLTKQGLRSSERLFKCSDTEGIYFDEIFKRIFYVKLENNICN